MTEANRQHRGLPKDNDAARYSAEGHPSVEQLTTEQGTGPIADVSSLHGDFWPEEESIEEFLAALHEWRGHSCTDPAA